MPHSRPAQERPGDARVLDCLYRVGAFVNATEDPREALDFILEEIVRTLGASSASIALVEPATGSLRIEVSNGLDADSTGKIIDQGQGITGWVALYAKPQRIPDVSKDPRYVEIRKGIRSELAVPMELMGNVIGVVNCDSDRLDAFSEQDVAFLSLLTNEASKAVGRIWLLRQLRSKAAQLEALVRAAQGLARERDEPGISLDLARHTRALLGTRACAYYNLVEDELHLRSLDGDLGASVLAPSIALNRTSLGTVVTRGRSVVVPLAGKTEDRNVHIGPSDYVAWLDDRKWAFVRLEGRNFGDVPLSLEYKLEVWDSPNSAGIIIDAIRAAKIAKDRGIGGPILSASSYFMKSPPVQCTDHEARERTEAFIRGDRADGDTE